MSPFEGICPSRAIRAGRFTQCFAVDTKRFTEFFEAVGLANQVVERPRVVLDERSRDAKQLPRDAVWVRQFLFEQGLEAGEGNQGE